MRKRKKTVRNIRSRILICVELTNEAWEVVVPEILSKNLSSKFMAIPYNETVACGILRYDGISFRFPQHIISLLQKWRCCSPSCRCRRWTNRITVSSKCTSIATTFADINFCPRCWIESTVCLLLSLTSISVRVLGLSL